MVRAVDGLIGDVATEKAAGRWWRRDHPWSCLRDDV